MNGKVETNYQKEKKKLNTNRVYEPASDRHSIFWGYPVDRNNAIIPDPASGSSSLSQVFPFALRTKHIFKDALTNPERKYEQNGQSFNLMAMAMAVAMGRGE